MRIKYEPEFKPFSDMIQLNPPPSLFLCRSVNIYIFIDHLTNWTMCKPKSYPRARPSCFQHASEIIKKNFKIFSFYFRFID